MRYDFGELLAQWFGHPSTDRFTLWNGVYTGSVLGTEMRTFEWTFINKPLRRYEPSKRRQGVPIERSLSLKNVLFDAFDLLQNQRGVGWSWSQNSFPHESAPPTSITLLVVKTLLKLTVLDASQYILQCVLASFLAPLWPHCQAFAGAFGYTRGSIRCIMFPHWSGESFSASRPRCGHRPFIDHGCPPQSTSSGVSAGISFSDTFVSPLELALGACSSGSPARSSAHSPYPLSSTTLVYGVLGVGRNSSPLGGSSL